MRGYARVCGSRAEASYSYPTGPESGAWASPREGVEVEVGRGMRTADNVAGVGVGGGAGVRVGVGVRGWGEVGVRVCVCGA